MGWGLENEYLVDFKETVFMNMFIVVSDVLTINYSLCNKLFEVGHICKYVLVPMRWLAIITCLQNR